MPEMCRARVPVGGACAVISDCDDGCFCDGAERCEAGVCVAGVDPCADAVDCTRDSCDEPVRGCSHRPTPALCSDGDACNGAERCDVALGCVPGAALACDDGDDCTTDTCDAATGCASAPRDRDGDGFGDGFCGGTDCLDDPALGGASVAPGRVEVCDNDLDDDCDGLRDFATLGCIPTNDACATARVLPGAGSYSASTRGLSDDYALHCPGGFPSGPVTDAVFRVTVPATSDLVVSVHRSGPAYGLPLGMTVRRFDDCATGPELRELACGTSTSLRVRSAPPGDYAILVSAEVTGSFDLVVELDAPTTAPPVDVCGAGTLDVSAGGTFRAVRGDLHDDYGLTCNSVTPPMTRADAAYVLTLASPKDVQLDLTPSGALALVSDCAAPASTLACVPDRSGGVSTLFRRSLPAGSYFILAEPNFTGPSGGTLDDFALDVRVSEPTFAPPGDSCSSAALLSPDVPLSTPLDALAFDVGLSCSSPSSMLARDLVYSFTLATAQDVSLRFTTPLGPFFGDSPTLALTSTCGDATGQRSCTFVDGANVLEHTWRSVSAGTWYVVAGTTATTGSVEALLTLAPPTAVPANDDCSGATELVSGTPVLLALASYDDDLSLSCGYGGTPDAVYSFTLPRRQNVALIASPVGGSGLIGLALRSACTTGPDLGCSEAEPSSISTTLDAGTYYVVVEGDVSIPQVRLSPFFTDI